MQASYSGPATVRTPLAHSMTGRQAITAIHCNDTEAFGKHSALLDEPQDDKEAETCDPSQDIHAALERAATSLARATQLPSTVENVHVTEELVDEDDLVAVSRSSFKIILDHLEVSGTTWGSAVVAPTCHMIYQPTPFMCSRCARHAVSNCSSR